MLQIIILIYIIIINFNFFFFFFEQKDLFNSYKFIYIYFENNKYTIN